jgi:hypothetical protein
MFTGDYLPSTPPTQIFSPWTRFQARFLLYAWCNPCATGIEIMDTIEIVDPFLFPELHPENPIGPQAGLSSQGSHNPALFFDSRI